MLKRFWNYISHLGINDSIVDLQERKTRIFFNRAMIIGAAASILETIEANKIVSNLGYLNTFWGLMCFLSLLLAAKEKYNVAKYVIIISVYLFGGAVSTALGPSTIFHVGAISIFVYGLVIFRKNVFLYMMISFPLHILLIVLAELNLYERDFSHLENILQLRIMAFSMMLAICTIFIYFILRLNSDQEKLLAIQNKQLDNEVKEGEALITEIHHRVKNNLQVISSLLNLQKTGIENKNPEEILQKSQDRINSIALIHEKLYQSKSYSKIDLKTYTVALCRDLKSMYDLSTKNIEIKIDVDNVNLNLEQSTPCGILMNELITNAIKYAFDENGGKIYIIGKVIEDKIILIVKDNGIGLPDNINEMISHSVGLRLSQGLAKQIGGSLSFKNKNGAKFTLTFNQ